MDFGAPAKVGAHDSANELGWKIPLDLAPRLDTHCPQIRLAETGLAVEVIKAGIAEPEGGEPSRQGVETFPRRLHVAQPIADIVGRQYIAMFVRLLLLRRHLQQRRERGERVRLAGERRRERLHIDEVAPVRSYLLVGFVRDVVVSVVVLPLIRVEFFRGPIPCEADKRRPLREVLHGDRWPIF